MKMLYEARVRDLGPEDQVKVQCSRCLHSIIIPQIGMVQGMRLPSDTLIASVENRFRCRECDMKGSAIVTIVWAGAPSNPAYRQYKAPVCRW